MKKMSTLVDRVDKIFCINLDKRPDRWEAVLSQFNKVGLDGHVQRYSAIEASPGVVGCTLSHYNIIKKAKEEGYKNVLIFEDDVEFIRTDQFEDTIINSFSQLESLNIDYDMFYLGGNVKGNNNKRINTNLVELNNVKCAHAYITCESVYDTILNIIDAGDINNIWSWNGGNPDRLNIDYTYAARIAPNYNVYGVWPMLAKQAAGISDLNGEYHDYKIDEKWAVL